MRTVLALVVVAAALVVWLLVGGTPPVERVVIDEGRQAAPVTAQREAGPPARADPDARAQQLRERAAERAVMRERIREALAQRAAALRGRQAGQDAEAKESEQARRARKPAEAEPLPLPNQIIDRTGNRPYLSRVLTEELIPLADECYQMARERKPELAGMLVFRLDIVGDQDVGGVVDSAAPAPNNELADPDLIECVRESLLATTLPPPEEGGRDSIDLSMRLSPDEP